jgi:hypothetical protein
MSVPKISVDKNDDPFFLENKIGGPKDDTMAPPTFNAVGPKQSY